METKGILYFESESEEKQGRIILIPFLFYQWEECFTQNESFSWEQLLSGIDTREDILLITTILISHISYIFL